ncbi:Sec-independent protein translocase protein TatB [Ensifer adhaerens]|uniref:Sec-independent protein translocase protein TatB n=1 Tax=Ensifer adhaerens TaxID=106592 RepID=UPI0023A92E44|nr:Sec-independent protein translocase protein TatB [Ensifer adhaerens]WDZ78173.1 Sec-independent protein translocase protein TatB [Ensifer adhaerens]
MLDIGWTELVVIAIVLIVVVGPKDLPPMLRAFGRMTAKMRGMASEFRQQFDEALREADLDEVRKTISDAQSLNPANALRDAMNPLRQIGNDIKSDLQKAATPDKPAATGTTDLATAEPVTAAPVAAAETKPADSVAAAAVGSATRQLERAEVAVPAERPKRAPKAKADPAPAAKPAVKKAAAPKATAPNTSAKAPAKAVAEKKSSKPASAEPATKTSKPRASTRKKGEA